MKIKCYGVKIRLYYFCCHNQTLSKHHNNDVEKLKQIIPSKEYNNYKSIVKDVFEETNWQDGIYSINNNSLLTSFYFVHKNKKYYLFDSSHLHKSNKHLCIKDKYLSEEGLKLKHIELLAKEDYVKYSNSFIEQVIPLQRRTLWYKTKKQMFGVKINHKQHDKQ